MATCLAHGYQSRIVLSFNNTDPTNLRDIHVWAEVKLDSWVHVDPSWNPPAWNTPYMYEEKADWGKDIGSKVKIYAFEDGKYEDVTSNYKQKD